MRGLGWFLALIAGLAVVGARAADAPEGKVREKAPASVPDQPRSSRPVAKGARVCICGHSFHVFIAEPLAALAKEAGLTGHETVCVNFLGNSRPIRHWNLPDGRNPVKAALRAGNVDVLTLSPHTVLPEEGIDRFADLAIEKNPSIRVYLQLSWPPYDAKSPLDFKFEDRDRATTEELDAYWREHGIPYLNRLRAQASQINERHHREFVYIVPVGIAIWELRKEILAGRVPGLSKQSELFHDVNGHGTKPLKDLAAYCWFAAIYRRSPVGLSALATKGDDTSRKLQRKLEAIAWEKVLGESMSGVKAGD